MIEKIKLFFNNKELAYLFFLLILILLATFAELIGIASIPIFLGLVINPQKIIDYLPQYFENLINFSYFQENIVVNFSIILIFIFASKNLYLFIVSFLQAKFFRDLRVKNTDRLLNYFFSKQYIYFVNNDPAKLLRSLSSDLDLANNYLEQSLHILREIIVIGLVVSLLLFVNTNVSLAVFVGTGLTSYFIFSFFKKKLIDLAKLNFKERIQQIKIINQIFFNIQEIKISLKENFFLNQYNKVIYNIKKTEFFNQVFSKAPRLILETFAVISMVLIIIYFSKKNYDIKEIIPLLSLLGMAALRLIPSFNIITVGFAGLKKSEISFYSIVKLLKDINKDKFKKNYFENTRNNSIINSIEVENVSFKYPNSEKFILKNISFKLKNNSSIGIVGKTGCGKSTLIRLLAGLLSPSEGKILVNKIDINNDIKSWYKNLSYIPQNIYLNDDTIRKNIAIGEYDSEIDEAKLKISIKLSGLENFVNNLDLGLETFVGADGIKLSGGQVQRIGIARAIYLQPNVFILDEATNSLDEKTEREILKDFNKLKTNKFLIMISHRLTSLKNCDVVFYIVDGQIKDSGTIQQLIDRNPNLIK